MVQEDLSDTGSDRVLKLYDRLRSQSEHENELYNQQIVWLISMQAFLYGSMALLLQAKLNSHRPDLDVDIDGFTALVCATGFAVAMIANGLLANTRRAFRVIGKLWDLQILNVAPLGLPHVLGGDGSPSRAILLRSGNLPKLFAITWFLAAALFFRESLEIALRLLLATRN